MVVEQGNLALESEDASVDPWDAKDFAGVADQIAGRNVVGSIKNYIVSVKDFKRV